MKDLDYSDSFYQFNYDVCQKSFLLPEGYFSGFMTHFSKDRDKKGSSQLVLNFEITSYREKHTLFLARSIYRDQDLPKLIDHLEGWQGADFAQKCRAEGGLDFNTLVGCKADLEILHKENPNHKERLRVIHQIYPFQTLVKVAS